MRFAGLRIDKCFSGTVLVCGYPTPLSTAKAFVLVRQLDRMRTHCLHQYGADMRERERERERERAEEEMKELLFALMTGGGEREKERSRGGGTC
jgi:hypothetical protein